MTPSSIVDFIAKRRLVLVLILMALATLRTASTYTLYSQTADEAIHIACGLEWLSKGRYTYEEQHPPLTRIMVALGPYFDGARSTDHQDPSIEGLTVLRGNGKDLERRLMLARMGNLPFLWIACLAVFLIGRKMLGDAGGVVALFSFTMIPSVLAHAGLATTDMGATAFFTLAVYSTILLLERPDPPRAALLGAAWAGMVLSKFSTVVFYPAAVLITGIVLWRRRKQRDLPDLAFNRRTAISILLSSAVAFVLIWAGYRFSFGPAPSAPFQTPFPEVFEGIRQVAAHNDEGHTSYLLGTRSRAGFWLYFPVVLLVKIPLALILLAAASFKLRQRQASSWPLWIVWTVFLGILLLAMNSRINIGLRHILPAIPFLTVAAAAGLMGLFDLAGRSRFARHAALAAVLLIAVPSAFAHPDYLPYFNLLAGSHPEDIVVDSDLDWGQDMKRLGQRLRELNAPFVVFTPPFGCDLDGLGFPPRQPFDPLQPQPGYNAVGLTPLKLNRMFLPENEPNLQPWPERYGQYEMVGKTIRLYYFSLGRQSSSRK